VLVAGNMKRIFANNFFKNPEGWAGKAVGSPWRYRYMQGMTVLGGVIVFVFFILASNGYDGTPYFGVALFVFSFVVAFPLMYLKALRYLYLKTRHFEINQQGAEPDRPKSRPPG
jgi:hypothetical protein